MRIKQTGEGQWEERWVDAAIEDAEAFRRDERTSAPTMVPSTMRVAWQRGGYHETWAVKVVLIKGNTSKRDGTLGARRTFTYYGERDVPEWARDWIAEHRPTEGLIDVDAAIAAGEDEG